MNRFSRRDFLHGASGAALSPSFSPPLFSASAWLQQTGKPHISFSAVPRERISVASYPFRESIAGQHDATSAASGKMPLKDFAAHVKAKFDVKKVEPWSEHFLSLELTYLDEIRNAAAKAGSSFANIAADGESSFYAADDAERQRAIHFGKTWIDVAAHLGSPSVRLNIPVARNAKPSADVAAQSLKPLADYAASKNVVVHLENDNPVSENPFFIVGVVDRIASPWIHALPDFGNSLAALPPAEAYRGLDEMFARAYAISHVKDTTTTAAGVVVQVDMPRIFALAMKHYFDGVFSMEWETAGDVYAGTSSLIATTIKNLS
jgi:sugar phosphate isomerase/epimerase